jgi:mercuric ion binding protein
MLVGISPAKGVPQIREVTVKLDGLSCPFCAYGLEKKLKKVAGVEKLEIKVDAGTARLTVQKGQRLSIEVVERTIKEGGFTPREVTVDVVGHLAEMNGRPVLKFAGADDLFLVTPNATFQRLKDTLKEGGEGIAVTGKVTREERQGHAGHPYLLSIEDVALREGRQP